MKKAYEVLKTAEILLTEKENQQYEADVAEIDKKILQIDNDNIENDLTILECIPSMKDVVDIVNML